MKSNNRGLLCKLHIEKAYVHITGISCSCFKKKRVLGRDGLIGLNGAFLL